MDSYPRMLYHYKTLQPVIVESAAEEFRLMHTGHYVQSPADVGYVSAPMQGRPSGLSSVQRKALASGNVENIRDRRRAMYKAIMSASLADASVEELVLLDGLLKLITAGLESRDLDVSIELLRRQQQIDRQMVMQLEDDLAVAEYELETLEPPENRRLKKAKRVQRLKKVVETPRLHAVNRTNEINVESSDFLNKQPMRPQT